MAELPLTNGADGNAEALDGSTPLRMAAYEAHNYLADLLRPHSGPRIIAPKSSCATGLSRSSGSE